MSVEAQPGISSAACEVIVDCDIHESLRSVRDLLPYLGAEWHPYVSSGNAIASPPYSIRGGAFRLDAKRDDGSTGGMHLDQIQWQHLDAHHISIGILLAEFGLGLASLPQRELANALSRAYNLWLLDHFIGQDRRLKGSLAVAPQVPDAAAEVIREFGQHPDIVQVMLPYAAPDVPWGNERYDPIWRACCDTGLKVAFHLGMERGLTGAPVGGWPRTYMQLRAGYPLQFQAQLIDMVCNGLFERFPELGIVLVEGGFGWVPNVLWRLDSSWRSMRAEVPWLRRKPSEYVREHVRFTTQPFDEAEDPADIDLIIDMMGGDHLLLFSTDYPHWDFDAPEKSFPRTMSQDRKRRILGENALAFYNF
jgi:uncharacterized protein